MKRSFLLCLAVLAMALVCLAPKNTFVASAKSDKFKKSQNPVPNQYIVVLKETELSEQATDFKAEVKSLNGAHRGRTGRIFTNALKGYSVETTEDEAIRLSEDPLVEYVEEDSFVESQSIQTDATWGLSRIDQRVWQYPLSTEYHYGATGTGVNVYIIDSGILASHPDFGGRVVNAFDAFNDPTPISECSGHGTHVAGTVGSNTYGVAKNVTLYSIRVQPCSGYATTSSIIAGIDWINRNVRFPAVANMSLASTYSQSFETAVKNSIALGITYTVAAGNYSTDACNYSPAHLPEAITVGSMDPADTWDPATNYGRCIDLFAPGVSVESTWNTVQYPSFILSGTSTAAPHAAGVAALYLEINPTATPKEVQDALVNNATAGVIYNLGNTSPNLLLFSDFIGSTATPSPTPLPSPSPSPTPTPAPIACNGTEFRGSISSPGFGYQSSKTGFTARQGILSASLNVPANSNFRLNLEKKSGGSRDGFVTVLSSTGGNSTETIAYRAKNGTYRWRIESLQGSGTYTLCTQTP